MIATLMSLSLPELIPTKTRRKQQPLLDYTKSIILTSRDYMKGLEELLAKKQTTSVATQKKMIKRQARGNASYSESNNKKKSKIVQLKEHRISKRVRCNNLLKDVIVGQLIVTTQHQRQVNSPTLVTLQMQCNKGQMAFFPHSKLSRNIGHYYIHHFYLP